MADFEKVWQLDFDTRKAENRIKNLDTRVAAFEKRLEKSFRNPALLKAINRFNLKLKTTDTRIGSIVAALGTFDSATARTATATENKFDRINRAIRRVGTAPGGASKRVERFLRATQQGAAKAGYGLDNMARRGRRATEALATGARRAERRLQALAPAARSVGPSITGLALRLSAFVGAAAAVHNVTSEYRAFDKQMTIAAAKFSKLEPQMTPGTKAWQQYRKEIRAAQVDTEHTASGVASAVDFWAKAGKTAAQTKAVIPTTLAFASANTDAAGAALDVARAGDILSDALGQFKLSTNDPTQLMENTARVADVMSAAANTANVSADELFESFNTAGPVLTAVGGDIEQTSALLAAMANAGIKGSIAGRQLKIAVAALNAPTKKQREMMAKYNISVQDNQGNTRKLTDIIGQLDKATRGLGTGKRFEVFGTLLGREGITGFLNLMAEGKVNLDAATESLYKAGGETKRLAEIARKSADAQLQRFWNRITDIGFQVIENTNLFDRLTTALRNIDWDAVSDTINTRVIPALQTAWGVIKNTLWPALKEGATILRTLLGPALDLVSYLMGKMSGEGGKLSKVLAYLGVLWVNYRVYLMAVKALGMVKYMADFAKSIFRAATAQGTLNAKTQATTSALGASVKQAGALNTAFGAIGAAIAGYEIGTLIYEEIVDPLLAAQDEAVKLIENVANAQGRLKGMSEPYLKMQLDELTKAQQARKSDTMMQVVDAISFGGAFGDYNDLLFGLARANVHREIGKRRQSAAETDILKAPQSLDLPGELDMAPEIGMSVDEDLQDQLRTIATALQQQMTPAPLAAPAGEMTAGWIDWGPMAETQQAQLKLAEQQALVERDWQSKMLAAQTRDSAPRETKIEVGPTSINIETHGGDPQEIKRVVRDELERRDRQLHTSLRDAARAVGPSEF